MARACTHKLPNNARFGTDITDIYPPSGHLLRLPSECARNSSNPRPGCGGTSSQRIRLVWSCCSSNQKEPLLLFVMNIELARAVIIAGGSILFLAGTVALRRLPKRSTHKAIAMRSRQAKTASMERAKLNFLQCVEAVRTQSIDRRAKLTKTARQRIFELIDDVAIPKTLAVAVAGVARSTYYHWRKIARSTNPCREQQPKPKYIKLTDRDYVKEALFKTLHSPPSDHGFNRTTWTDRRLATGVEKNLT